MRPLPSWIITDEIEYTERELGNLKSGKEAEIFVIERCSEDRSCLLAHKRYRPRSVSHKGELEELGFTRANQFMHDLAYRDGRKFAKSRDRRAAERMTKYGKRLLTARWTGHELEMLQHAWDAGVNVPCPVGARGEGLLMQYLGDLDGAAPSLGQARLERGAIESAREQVLENLELLVGAGFVHADLSAYNLLWWQERVWFIDFPQTVDVTVNHHAFEFLHRDVANVGEWFRRHGAPIDVEKVYGRLVALAGTR